MLKKLHITTHTHSYTQLNRKQYKTHFLLTSHNTVTTQTRKKKLVPCTMGRRLRWREREDPVEVEDRRPVKDEDRRPISTSRRWSSKTHLEDEPRRRNFMYQISDLGFKREIWETRFNIWPIHVDLVRFSVFFVFFSGVSRVVSGVSRFISTEM